MNTKKYQDLSLERIAANYKRDELLQMYWYFHPRFRFIKSAPSGSKVLDVGAGSGGMAYWKEWRSPNRKDIQLYAIDFNKGEHFDLYDDYQIGNIEEVEFKFKQKFDALILSHLLEHISEPEKLLMRLQKIMNPGALIYIEVPTPSTLELPSREYFLKNNIEVSTINFFDDNSHIQTYSLETLKEMLHKSQLSPIENGLIQNRYLGPVLYDYGVKNKDSELTTYGSWLQLNWAHYVIAKK